MTLLESCASVMIVSTMVVFSAPALVRAREHYQLDAVARQVAGKMQSTRIKAISRNRDCRVRIVSRPVYVVECQNPDWRIEERVALPRGFSVTSSATPAFHARGNVSPTATFTIWNDKSKSRRVVVNITGRIRVE